MAVVHGIIKDYGGDITIYSEIGKGTKFQIFLPLINKKEKVIDNITTTALPAGNERILFVDDEAGLCKVSKQIIERLGYKVDAQTSPEEALDKFKQAAKLYDLVITDKTMPHFTGFDLAREIRNIRSDIPIILCTGFNNQADLSMAQEIGIKEIILKPIDKQQIAEAIRKVLDKKGL